MSNSKINRKSQILVQPKKVGSKNQMGAPEGYENNWIQLNPKKGSFVYMGLYGPLESYFDKAWKMPDVKMVK
jgi:hypothetical protein